MGLILGVMPMQNQWERVAECYIVAVLNPEGALSDDYGIFFYTTKNIAYRKIEDFDIKENEKYVIDYMQYGVLIESRYFNNERKQIKRKKYVKTEEKK